MQVRVVTLALLNVLDIVDEVSARLTPAERTALRTEAEQTLLQLVAAVIVAHGPGEEEETHFLRLLFEVSTLPADRDALLETFAARWRASGARGVPAFLRCAAEFDEAHHTDKARAILCELQIAGNSAARNECDWLPPEEGVVRTFLAEMDAFLDGRVCRP